MTRRWLKTRISPDGWKLIPVPPAEAAAKISPVPLLIVHGDQDLYFPPEHARQLYMAAREPKELWLLPGMGHAEASTSQDLVDRIARWIDQATRDSTGSDASSPDGQRGALTTPPAGRTPDAAPPPQTPPRLPAPAHPSGRPARRPPLPDPSRASCATPPRVKRAARDLVQLSGACLIAGRA